MRSRQTVHLALVASLNDCFEQMGMIAWLGTQNIMVAITAQVVDMRRVAGQAIFSDDQLELRVLLFDPRQQPFCRVSFTIVFGLAVLFHNRFDRQRDDFFLIGMDQHSGHHLMRVLGVSGFIDFL